MIIITYDVNTTSLDGQRRLRKVAKICEKYGQRVQNSVFECLLDSTQYIYIKNELLHVIDNNDDSLRFYKLGNEYKNSIEVIGKRQVFSQDDLLIL